LSDCICGKILKDLNVKSNIWFWFRATSILRMDFGENQREI
jgi:hypothetical protein